MAYLLANFQLPLKKPIALYYDNQSTLHIAANQVSHERTKHIEIDCHVVRDKVQAGLIKLLPVASSHQIAHILTKALAPCPFTACYVKLGMLDLHTSNLRGVVT